MQGDSQRDTKPDTCQLKPHTAGTGKHPAAEAHHIYCNLSFLPSFLTDCHDNHAELHCEPACPAALLGASRTHLKGLFNQLIKSYSCWHAPAAGTYQSKPHAGSNAQPQVMPCSILCKGTAISL